MGIIKFSDRFGIRWGDDARRYNRRYSLHPINHAPDELQSYKAPESINAYELYSTTPHLKNVIQLKGDLLASGVWKHYRRNGNEIDIVENSEYVNLLENPNPLQKGNDYLKQLNESKSVFGQSFEYIGRTFGTKLPYLINILPPTEIEVKFMGKWYAMTKINEIIKEYRYNDNKTFTTDEINYEWNSNVKNPLVGESPLYALYPAIDNIRNAMQFRSVIMRKKGALGMLTNSTAGAEGAIPLTENERTKLEKQYQEQYGIDEEKSQILISNANLQWQSMSFPTRDLMLFEEVEEDFGQIIDAFGLKRDLFSSTKGATFENQKEALKQTYQSTIIPLSEEIAMSRTSLLGLDPSKEWLSLDYSHIPVLQENEKEKADIQKLRSQAVSTMRDKGFTNEEISSVTGIDLI